MKKVFNLNVSNKVPARQADSIKHEIKKYLGRERRKETPEGVDYWDFDCKMGETEAVAKVLEVKEINPMIDSLLADNIDNFYLEILAKNGYKTTPKK